MGITREPGLNSGLPDHDGLDEGTKAALTAAANKTGKGVIVGGVQDYQKLLAEYAKDDAEPAVNMPPGEDESSPTSMEHDATNPGGSQGAAFDDSYTVDELKAELEARGEAVSGTKQELIDRLNS